MSEKHDCRQPNGSGRSKFDSHLRYEDNWRCAVEYAKQLRKAGLMAKVKKVLVHNHGFYAFAEVTVG